mmetsp:Transcript_27840/g.81725  ORF Transcript_27840/g.81725 Transcript_27840/m.81725 type:complete len:253 (-) Transcript_27840:913-1671(-)
MAPNQLTVSSSIRPEDAAARSGRSGPRGASPPEPEDDEPPPLLNPSNACAAAPSTLIFPFAKLTPPPIPTSEEDDTECFVSTSKRLSGSRLRFVTVPPTNLARSMATSVSFSKASVRTWIRSRVPVSCLLSAASSGSSPGTLMTEAGSPAVEEDHTLPHRCTCLLRTSLAAFSIDSASPSPSKASTFKSPRFGVETMRTSASTFRSTVMPTVPSVSDATTLTESGDRLSTWTRAATAGVFFAAATGAPPAAS